MSPLLLMLALSVGQTDTPLEENPLPKGYSKISLDDFELRSFRDIHDDIREQFRKEATAESEQDRAQAIVTLTVLYREVMMHPRFAESDTLKEYRAKVWSRLTKVKRDLEIQVARQEEDRRREALRDGREYVPADSLASAVGQAGGQGVRDHGQALIDLIERTIRPEFWENVGGPGSIVYFAPLHALVVRATAEVHQNVADVLGQLRAVP